MKKIEEAARMHCGRDEQCRKDYIAGASYVLDAMTSGKAIGAFEAEVRKHGGCFSSRDALAAVRKEIEGGP